MLQELLGAASHVVGITAEMHLAADFRTSTVTVEMAPKDATTTITGTRVGLPGGTQRRSDGQEI